MTGILMDWLVEVAEEYHLTNETLHLAKQYIDRFLGLQKVTRARLQLVGVSGMLIASKFEEIFPPGVDDFVYISDNTFTRNQVIEMETTMLNLLQFDLTNPTALEFLMRYVRISNADTVCTSIAKYLTELTLMDYNMASFLPSHIALSSLMLASHVQNMEPALHRSLQGFVTPAEHATLTSCMNAVHKLWVGAPRSKLQAVRLKYERTRNNKVSLIVAPNMPPLF
jgi:cyclin A